VQHASSEATARGARPATVCVVGGGTAGYLAALAIERRFPDTRVTLLDSSGIPIIGVGEATTPLMPPFLHAQLGLDADELFRSVKPTLKLGIRFDWGLPGEYAFDYPFGETDPVHAILHDGTTRTQSITSALMARDRVPVLRGPDGDVLSLLPQLKFAYHLDNAPFVAFLERSARARGIAHLDRRVVGTRPREEGGGIRALLLEGGEELSFDFFIDATGFRSELLERALGSPFESYASSLFCDRAIVAAIPNPGGTIRPYTQAETMEAGWCWRIAVDGEDHRGYVFSSAFLDDDAAHAEMRAKNPGMGEPWTVRFRSGRHRDFLVGNVAAVGNAYGFVEPLESTALHMLIVELAELLAVFEAMETRGADAGLAVRASARIGAHWDDLRWFLAAHYRFNRRLDTRFWRTARADVALGPLADTVARFRREGPWAVAADTSLGQRDPTFGATGLLCLLLGQHVETHARIERRVSAEAWARRVAQLDTLTARALPQREALAQWLARPELVQSFSAAPASWVQRGAERVDGAAVRRVLRGG
jgi:tryptophan halogenase